MIDMDALIAINRAVPWPLLGGVFGALIGSTGSFIIINKQAKTTRVLEFHKEFHGKEFLQIRSAADEYVKANTADYLRGVLAS